MVANQGVVDSLKLAHTVDRVEAAIEFFGIEPLARLDVQLPFDDLIRQSRVVLDADKENEEWGSFFKHIRFKDESLANILKVMNLNSDSLQIQVASPALEERRLTVEFSDEFSEVVATLIASALGLQCVRQGDILLLSE